MTADQNPESANPAAQSDDPKQAAKKKAELKKMLAKKNSPPEKANKDKKDTSKLKEHDKVARELRSKLHEGQLHEKLQNHSGVKGNMRPVIIAGVFTFILLLVIVSLRYKVGGGIDYKKEYGHIAFIAEGEKATIPKEINLPKDLKPSSESWYVKIPKAAKQPAATHAIEMQKNAAAEYGLPLEVENDLGMKFRLIPPGHFQLGSPETEKNRLLDEVLTNAEIHKPFYIGKFEVTLDQWISIMGEAPKTPNTPQTHGDRAVYGISFNEALIFIQKLNKRYQLSEFTYSLPFEDQWEYACRAGTTTSWFFGEDPRISGIYGLCIDNIGDGLGKVGRYRPNPWGLYDIFGNMVEMTASKAWYYHIPDDTYAEFTNSTDPSQNYYEDKIYDGEAGDQYKIPLDKFKVPHMTKGIQSGLYFLDLNNDGRWTYGKGELIWHDTEDSGIYNHGKDTLIWRGTKNDDYDAAIHDGKRGMKGKVYYHDINDNLSWDPGEGIWKPNDYDRYRNGKHVFRDGPPVTPLAMARSAHRGFYGNNHKASFISFRLIRKLRNLKKVSQP